MLKRRERVWEGRGIALANIIVVGFPGKLAFERATWAERTVFQAEVTACAKVLKQEGAWLVQETCI